MKAKTSKLLCNYLKTLYFVLTISTITAIVYSCGSENNNAVENHSTIETEILHNNTYNWDDYEQGIHFGEILFVPVYSSVYHQSNEIFDLAATLSIHNTDLSSSIKLLKINYYNTKGKMVKSFSDGDLKLNPLESIQFIIKETDISGGTAPKFIIQWISDTNVTKPVVEAVMISTSSQQGISFKTESRVLSSIGY